MSNGNGNTNAVFCPPFPPQAATGKGLYRHLDTLRTWSLVEQNTLLELVPPRHRHHVDDLPPELASESVWGNVSVYDQFQVWQYLRAIREGWDATLRDHEDKWDGRLAVRRRFNLLCAAYHILREAFVSPEEREMRTQRAAEQQARIEHYSQKVLTPPDLRDSVGIGDSGDAEPLDRWFGDGNGVEQDDD